MILLKFYYETHTLLFANSRPTPSMQTWSRPPSPVLISWTGNSPPNSVPRKYKIITHDNNCKVKCKYVNTLCYYLYVNILLLNLQKYVTLYNYKSVPEIDFLYFLSLHYTLFFKTNNFALFSGKIEKEYKKKIGYKTM